MHSRSALSFDDVLITPQYSDILSRKNIDLTMQFGDKFSLQLPIISSPMDTVTSSCMVTEMYSAGGLGIVHRYNTVHDHT